MLSGPSASAAFRASALTKLLVDGRPSIAYRGRAGVERLSELEGET
jgi:hypothetical protein